MSKIFLRKYGEATTITFGLRETDGVALKSDAVCVDGDVVIMKDEGVEANVDADFVDEGKGYSLAFTAAEMIAARVQGYIEDQGTPVWLGKEFVIETYGHASAQHVVFPANIVQISEDSVAADNLESQYDATGLTGDTFPATQLQLNNIALTGAAISTPAKDAPNGFVITFGENEANNEDSTHALDNVTHDLEAINDGGTEKIECYYEFAIGGAGVPTGITAHHQFNKGGGASKNLTIWAYNWNTTTWDQIGTVLSSTSLETHSYTLFTSHVGTGGNLGLVRIRYLTGSVALTATSKLLTDQIFVEYAVVNKTVGYADGAIWVDTNASNTNTESFVDGTADNPVSTWAAALTLSGQLNITRFHIVNGSAITLTGNSDNYNIMGQGYTLALNNQSITSAYIFGATTSGIGTGGGTVFEDCPIGNVTLEPSVMRRCFYFGTITNSGTGDWFINDPRSRVAGSGSPVFDFGTAIGDTNLNIRGNSGGWQLESMGDTSTDTASIEGWGQVIEGSCTGGAVTIRGNFTTSGITNLTLSDNARFEREQLVDDILDEVCDASTHNVNKSLGKRVRGIEEYQGYEGGQIYINTTGGGSAGSESYVNGTLDNPVNNLADANIVAAALSIPHFHVSAGSSITLVSSQENQVFTGEIWNLALGNQSVSGTTFHGAIINGICTGAIKPNFEDCTINDVTLPPCHMHNCGLSGILTVGSTGDFFLADGCHSEVAGIGAPYIDFGAAIGDANLNLRNYSGGIELLNMGQAGTDNISIEGDGQVIINANSIGGTIAIRGHQTITGKAAFETAGGVISDDARFALDQLSELATQAAVLSRLASSVFGTDICPTSVSVTDGTTLSGTYEDVCTINQTYLRVLETGKFKIDFDFTGLSSTEDKMNVIYRYFGPGSTNHNIKAKMWNYITEAYDDVTIATKDFPNTNEDVNVELIISGTVSDYFTGTSPNIAAQVRIEHESNYNTEHQFWVDYITLGELEQIYVPADNASIASILDDIVNSTYGLSALQVLIEALGGGGIYAIAAQLYVTGGTTPIPNAIMAIYDSSNTTFLSSIMLDTNGQGTINLNPGTYKVRFWAAGYGITTQDLTVTTSEGKIFYGDSYVIPAPSTPDGTILVCDLIALGLLPKEGVEFKAVVANPPVKVGGAVVDATPMSATTNASGRAQFELVRGVVYDITSDSLRDSVEVDTTGEASITLASFIGT